MVGGALFERSSPKRSERIAAPGAVVLVVGPSGAGKDALLQGAAADLQSDACFVFPKRIISRPAHAAEDHDRASRDEMIMAEHNGAYALSWEAHGLIYAVPATIDDAVRAGSTVVLNTSRTVVSKARDRFQNVVALYIDAPIQIRGERLAARGRETETEIAKRLTRDVNVFGAEHADRIIHNDGDLKQGVDQLVSALKETRIEDEMS